jgi:hypothetical protein
MKLRVMLGMALLAALLSAQEATATTAAVATYSSSCTPLTEVQKVERLLQYIRTLEGATFIRNGMEHTCREAADHLQAKWEKHMSKIRTAEEFVLNLASASGLSGEAYKIRFPDGTIVTTKEVLLEELKRLEQQ